ncbi:hypothetical protein GALL_128140 [mine drainage metagenome]|uniref:Uncharacterized protein n=1 Tax=mine drainage metagenome TaxID=410659 RepID=A0A1J5SYA1_9ZZZZ
MKVIKTTEIYVPLMETEYENHFGKFDTVLNELCGLSEKLYVVFYKDKKSSLKIERATNAQVKKYFQRKKEKKFTKYFLKFTTEYSFIDKEEIEFGLLAVTLITESYVKYLLIFLNIAKPGAFDSREGITIGTLNFETKTKVDKDVFPMLANTIHLSLNLVGKYKWPPIQELSINDTLKWFDKHWEAFTTMPKNRIERALNAFSYLFHDSLADTSPSDLFFSLVGIEALFVEGNESVQKQVAVKSQLLLGKRNEFKKKFKELYEFRSRYVHGQLNLINKYYLRDADTDLQDHLSKTYDNSNLAILILIASIQKHILLDKDELAFEFILKD